MIRTSKRTFLCAIIVLTALFTCSDVVAQGTAGFEILRLQTQPRGSALAGALVADASQIENIFYNPAGLATISKRIGSAGYMNYLMDIESGYLAYADPSWPWGVWGINLIYTNYGDFDGRSETGKDLPDFSASDIEDYSGSALAFDLGGQYTLIEERLRLGAGIYNIGWTTNAYLSHKDDLPLYYRIGIWGVPRDLPANLYFSMTLYHEYADNYSLGDFSGSKFLDFLGDFYYGIGAEFHPMEALYLRVGYDTKGLDQKVGTKKDGFAGLGMGIGIDAQAVRLDFCLASYGELGLVQRLALSGVF